MARRYDDEPLQERMRKGRSSRHGYELKQGAGSPTARRKHRGRPKPLKLAPRSGKQCSWCKAPVDLSTGNLCAGCRVRCDAGEAKP